MPRIFLNKGFVIFDPKDDIKLFNKLKESTFLTPHYRNKNQFYCMLNNYALKFLKTYSKFLSIHFDIDEELVNIIMQDEIEYVPKRDEQLKPVSFKGITWKKHQKVALEYISKFKKYCIFLGPGTGKTLIAIGAIKMIEDSKPESHTYLVVTPKKAIQQYSSEIKKYLPSANVLTKPKEINLEDFNIFVTNYESIDKYTFPNYTCMILDESHKAKNVSSGINKTLCNINADNIYLFTGTPQDKQRDEVFAQLKILNPLLLSTKTLFFNRYFVLDEYFKPIKELHSEELIEIIEHCTYGDKTENLIDLPQEVEKVATCTLGELRETYKKFLKKKVLKCKNWYALGDSGAKHRTKLTQLCSGFIYDEDGKPHRTPYNPKETIFTKLLDMCPQAIIYTVYDEEQKIVSEILKKNNKSFVCVNGQTKDAPEALQKFKDGSVDYLVIQIVSGNAALDFPHINNIIYYSLHDSFIYFEQSKYRIRRIGQTRECNYYYIIVKGTVEHYRLASLQNKKSFNNSEFNIYKRRDTDEVE